MRISGKQRLLVGLLMLALLFAGAYGCSSPDEQDSMPASGDMISEPDEGDSSDSADATPQPPADGSDDQQAPASLPGSPTTPSKDVRTTDDGDLFVLVNKEYHVSADYRPTDMVKVDGSLSTNQNLEIKKDAYDAYLAMLNDAKAAGLSFAICSAYRSYDTQKAIYENGVSTYGEDYAAKLYAKPGRSEHHTGYAIDITSQSMNWGLAQNFADYPEGAWIDEHCAEYGFILRYLKGKEDITGYMYEPWHIRYVGKEAARYITDHGLTLEEYLGVA